MAEKHPYISAQGALIKLINHLRKTLPPKIDAQTIKKLGFAPNNESYAINIFRFLDIIDENGENTAKAKEVFNLHNDKDFEKSFSDLVKEAYSDLFATQGPEAWNLEKDNLITYFRSADHTSAIVGQRQASTFSTLASFSGFGELPAFIQKASKGGKKKGAASEKTISKTPKTPKGTSTEETTTHRPTDISLTVRVEINLPAEGDQKTYDRIFKSIKENFLNGNKS